MPNEGECEGLAPLQAAKKFGSGRFIRHGDFADTLKIAGKLLGDMGIDSPGRGLDAEGSWEAGRGGVGGVLGQALPRDISDDAPLRHRAFPLREAAEAQERDRVEAIKAPGV